MNIAKELYNFGYLPENIKYFKIYEEIIKGSISVWKKYINENCCGEVEENYNNNVRIIKEIYGGKIEVTDRLKCINWNYDIVVKIMEILLLLYKKLNNSSTLKDLYNKIKKRVYKECEVYYF